jgi:hypothetical protein
MGKPLALLIFNRKATKKNAELSMYFESYQQPYNSFLSGSFKQLMRHVKQRYFAHPLHTVPSGQQVTNSCNVLAANSQDRV